MAGARGKGESGSQRKQHSSQPGPWGYANDIVLRECLRFTKMHRGKSSGALRASKGTGGAPDEGKQEKIRSIETRRQQWFAQRAEDVPAPKPATRPASVDVPKAPVAHAPVPRSAPSGDDYSAMMYASQSTAAPRAVAVSDDVLTSVSVGCSATLLC